jgi:protein gp37
MKVSEGCKHCYAETLSKRWGKNIWGPDTDRPRTKQPWKDILKWDKEARGSGVRVKVFCQSMSDFFEDHPALPEMRNEAMRILESLTNCDIQLLTKRPENIPSMAPNWMQAWPKHIWIGTSVENQETADKRIPELLKVPAKVRFLSCEPLLGPLNLYLPNSEWKCQKCDYEVMRRFLSSSTMSVAVDDSLEALYCPNDGYSLIPKMDVHWVIVGGESGPKARVFDESWARDIKSQCKDWDVPFFMKQLGSNTTYKAVKQSYRNLKNEDIDNFPLDLRIREFPQ